MVLNYQKHRLIFINLFVILLSFTSTLLYLNFMYPIQASSYDLPTVSYTINYTSFFEWQPFDYSGLLNVLGTVIKTPILILISIVNSLGGLFIATFFSIFLYVAVTSTGSFNLVYFLTEGSKFNQRLIAGVFSATLIIFNFVYTQSLGLIAFMPWSILLMLILFKGLENGKKHIGIYLSLFILSTAADLSFATYLLGIQSFISLLIIGLILAFIYNKKTLKRAIFILLVALIFAIIINSSVIVSAYLVTIHKFYGTSTGSYGSVATGNINIINNLGENNFIESISTYLVLNTQSNLEHIGLRDLIIDYRYAALLAIFIILFTITTILLLNKNSKFIFAILAMLIILSILSITYSPPFGKVFLFLSMIMSKLHVNFLYVFGLYWISDNLILFFVALLFPIAILFSYNRIKINRLYKVVFVFFVLILILGYFYIEFFVPYIYGLPYTNNYYKISAPIPKHVFQIADFIDSLQGNFSVMTLPQEAQGVYAGQQLDTWYFGPDLYVALIHRTVYSGCGGATYASFFYAESGIEFCNANSRIDNRIIKNMSITNTLGIFGVKYIIVQGDALNTSNVTFITAPNFTYATILKNLNQSKHITFIRRYANSSIYENNNYDPLVYPANITSLNTSNLATLFEYIANRQFSIQHMAVYDPYLPNISISLSAHSINDFSNPNITFVVNTPTKITVHVSSATTPYYLVFRETYDQNWAAFYSNGTEVNSNDHIAVNGFANAWYMNKTGNYTITLYYTLQTYAWIAWAISIAAFGVTVSIGVYGWKESKKHSKPKHKQVRA